MDSSRVRRIFTGEEEVEEGSRVDVGATADGYCFHWPAASNLISIEMFNCPKNWN